MKAQTIAMILSISSFITGCSERASSDPREGDVNLREAPPEIFIGDGTRVSAISVLYAAKELAAKENVRIIFGTRVSGYHSIKRLSLPMEWNAAAIDGMYLTLTNEGILLNDEPEPIARSELQLKLEAYGQSAFNANGIPMLTVDAAEGVPGKDLVTLLNLLRNAQFSKIFTRGRRFSPHKQEIDQGGDDQPAAAIAPKAE